MSKPKAEPKTKTTLPHDAETLCAILARVIERIIQTSQKAGA